VATSTGPDAGHALQQRGSRQKVAIARDRRPDQPRDLPPFGTPALERRFGALAQGQGHAMTELLAARGDLGRELAAIGQELGQDLARAGDQRGRPRPGERAVTRDHRGIDPVGFGQATARLSEVAHARGHSRSRP
jgi:hypothetical protein